MLAFDSELWKDNSSW